MKKLFLLGVLNCLMLLAFGQVRFYGQLNTKTTPLNQNIQLSYTIENAEGQNLKLPNLNDFQVLSGPHTSQSMQWVNGNMSQSVSYSYILKPKKEGTFKVGKASINVGGATVESNELSIQVTAASQQSAQQQRRSNNPFGWDPFEDPFGNDPFDPFGQQQQQEEEPSTSSDGDIDKQVRENLFLRMVTSKNKVYVGEHVTATLKLYYRLNFGNTQMAKAPKFDGFWSQEVVMDPNQKPRVEKVNGQEFYVIDVQKYDLYPQRAGNLQISGTELNMIVQAQVQSQRRSVWDMFGGAQLKNIQYKPTSNPIAITVEELPSNGKPVDFSGAVGKFDMEAKLSSLQAKTDEAITLSIKLVGTGNLKTIELPKPILPDGFEAFDPKTKESIIGISGTKQADYLLIPRQPGQYKIEAIPFSFFNPETGKYVSLKSNEFDITINGAPSKAMVENNPTLPNSAAVKELGKDIRYIKTQEAFDDAEMHFIGSPLHYGLMISPLLLFIGAFVFKKKKLAESSDIIGTRIKKATKMARKRLQMASQHLKSNQPKLFYDEISRALLGYLSDKLQIPAADLSKDNIASKLMSKNIDDAQIDEVKKMLEHCDMALYSNQVDSTDMSAQYQNAIQLITSLDQKLSK
jgi:hypothetical protein